MSTVDSLAPFRITSSEVHMPDMVKDVKKVDDGMSEDQKGGTDRQTEFTVSLPKSGIKTHRHNTAVVRYPEDNLAYAVITSGSPKPQLYTTNVFHKLPMALLHSFVI